MLMTLYRDGAVQLTRDFSLQVLQGMCVGGSTVVNNAVCIGPPSEVLDVWEQRLGGRLAAADVAAAGRRVRELLGVETTPDGILARTSAASSPARSSSSRGSKARTRRKALRSGSVEANIHDCLGCGYCNIGCAYGRKALGPRHAAARGARSASVPSGCASCAVPRRPRLGLGRPRRRRRVPVEGAEKLRVRADRVVVAAGTVSSSWLLTESAPRRRASRRGVRVQHGLSDHGRVRRRAALLRRAADLASAAARRRCRVRDGDVVQPRARAGARDARVVRGPPSQHAALCPHGRTGVLVGTSPTGASSPR